MTQEETMEIFKNYFSYINRPGAADLLQWIESNGLDNAFRQCKLAVMLHLADMMATHFDEREVAQE